jgi:hypothetical protein
MNEKIAKIVDEVLKELAPKQPNFESEAARKLAVKMILDRLMPCDTIP